MNQMYTLNMYLWKMMMTIIIIIAINQHIIYYKYLVSHNTHTHTMSLEN